ncbi:TPA: helix-turn-helix domain-containing protein [Escherichia coli]
MSTKLTGYVWDGCAASGMKLSSVAIMARLADFSNDEGVCWPSIETIARQIGAGMSTVRTAIARLEAEGWLTRKARRQGIRQMLFKALLGWNPEACGNPITYDGGTLLDLNRHELIYQFDFSVISELTEDDTRQQDDLNSLDELRTLAIDVDYLDPGNGPDGDIEHHTEITLPS